MLLRQNKFHFTLMNFEIGMIVGDSNLVQIEIISLDPFIGRVVTSSTKVRFCKDLPQLGQELYLEPYRRPSEIDNPTLEPKLKAWIYQEDYSDWKARHGSYMGGWLLYEDKNKQIRFTHTIP